MTKPDASRLNELKALIQRHADTPMDKRPLPGLRLAAATAPTPSLPYMAEPAFALVLQGEKRTALGKQVIDYTSGQYLIFPVDLPLSGRITRASVARPFLGLSITLKPEAIAALLLDARGLPKKQDAPPALSVSLLDDDLLDAVLRLVRLLDRPEDIPILGAATEREVLWRLIQGEQGISVSQLGVADSHTAQIARSIRWIREHYAEPFRIEHLASMVDMSVTSFHRHFARVTSLSPIQFQKQIRLQEARSLLLSTSHDVTRVGFAVGYDNPSQFSREYRRAFGTSPGQDSLRLQTLEAAGA